MNILKILSGKGVDTQEITESVTVDTDVSVKETDQMASTDTQVTQVQVNETMANAIAKLADVQVTQANEVAEVKSMVAQLIATERAYQKSIGLTGTPESAKVEVESTSASTQAPEIDGAVNLREGEIAFGNLRLDMGIRGIDFEKGALVTVYEDNAGKSYKRVWADGKSRLLPKATWENKGLVSRASTPAKAAKKEQAASARQGMIDAVNRYNGETVMYAKGTKIHRTKNGKAQLPARDGRAGPFVKEDIVSKKGTLKKAKSITYFPDGLTGKVKRHMAAKCTCLPAWPCPAVQIIGPQDTQVGEHLYTLAGAKDTPFLAENITDVSLTTKSTKQFLAQHLDVWGLDS